MDIMTPGAFIDNMRSEVERLISQAKEEENTLLEKGCIKAYVHYKSKNKGDEKKVMFLLTPTDPKTGKRTYLHVGVDPERQQEALAKVKREEKRERIEQARSFLERHLIELDRDIRSVCGRFSDVLKDSVELKELVNAREERSEPNQRQGSY